MNFFKKILKKKVIHQDKNKSSLDENTSLETLFAHHFSEKGGKFLYCTSKEEVQQQLASILIENEWDFIHCSPSLKSYLKEINVTSKEDLNSNVPIFINCEFLIAENGSILFSSHQLNNHKIHTLNDNFIVLATISQLVKDIGGSLAAIKSKYKKELPTNISAIKNYFLNNSEDNFLNYGNNNTKNLYLLLVEDL